MDKIFLALIFFLDCPILKRAAITIEVYKTISKYEGMHLKINSKSFAT